jgi:hypothetical protein
VLKLFMSFVALVGNYGYFRPTEKMIFTLKHEVKVWINEDIFSNEPMMPIGKGAAGEKYFVIAFLALAETCLSNWDRVNNVTTIEETLRMLEWRCRLAKGSRTALLASQQVNHRSQNSKMSFASSEFDEPKGTTCSQQLAEVKSLNRINGHPLTTSFTVPKRSFVRHTSEFRILNLVSKEQPEREDEGAISASKKKLNLHSTSSTIGNFSEKWRTTVGRKKLLERAEQEA